MFSLCMQGAGRCCARTTMVRGGCSAAAHAATYARVPAACVAPHSPAFAAGIPTSSVLHPLESHFSGTNVMALESIYTSWKLDPSSVNVSFAQAFTQLDRGEYPDPSATVQRPEGAEAPGGVTSQHMQHISERLLSLVHMYRTFGHARADLDPLGRISRADIPHYSSVGLSEADLDHTVELIDPYAQTSDPERVRGWDLVARLERAYCGPSTCEFLYIGDRDVRKWLANELERPGPPLLPSGSAARIWRMTMRTRMFEMFLQRKLRATKRFGVEGCESLLVALDTAVRSAAAQDVSRFVIGMAHRGRLNTLAHVLRKPYVQIFREFGGMFESAYDLVQGSGDVKYHLGASTARLLQTARGPRETFISLSSNPSHLEAVNPVVAGMHRAFMQLHGSHPDESLSVLIHGDAAFPGQGVVAETLQLGELDDYSTFGTLHLIVNNQIGFTTLPMASRSTLYCTDPAKAVGAPIFHVNADHPDEVARVTDIAMRFRQRFFRDVVVDVIGYREFGHNEADNPEFTQPLMYKAIRSHPRVDTLHTERLMRAGLLTESYATQFKQQVEDEFNSAWQEAKSQPVSMAAGPSASNTAGGARESADELNQNQTTVLPVKSMSAVQWVEASWGHFFDFHEVPDLPDAQLHAEFMAHTSTGVSEATFKQVSSALCTVPDGFALHPILRRKTTGRAKALDQGKGIDWATGEALAFGSLLAQGHFVRLSGQDCQRGTFSQRHAVWHCQDSGRTWTPLNHIPGIPAAPRPWVRDMRKSTARVMLAHTHLMQEEMGLRKHSGLRHPVTSLPVRFDVVNSSLSEAAVLGFEHGMSVVHPDGLFMFEGQFGDFINTAQFLIDTFIAPGQSKWGRQSGIVLLCPHGFEGQGPEHSSARLERYLQICDGGFEQPTLPETGIPEPTEVAEFVTNMRVVYPSTPANYFHVLRSQVRSIHLCPTRREMAYYRKPLIVMTPKSLLTRAQVVSELADFGPGTRFIRVIPEPSGEPGTSGSHLAIPGLVSPERMRKVIFCSGKVYYDAHAYRAEHGITDAALVRVEQLAPFPWDEIAAQLLLYPAAAPVWLQEEPENQGAWPSVAMRWNRWAAQLPRRDIQYAGRAAAASPATGYADVHQGEQTALLARAFS